MSKALSFLLGVAITVLTLAVTGTLYLRHVAHGFRARERPTHMEAMLADSARSVAMPSSSRNLHNPVPSSPEALHEGLAHFADHCAVCHANNGSGETMLGSGMYPRPPDMRLPLTQSKTDGELLGLIDNGIRMSGMPAFGGDGGANDPSWKLVLFLRHLPQLTPAEQQEMEHLNPKSPNEMEEEKQEQDFLNGHDAGQQP